ncbi:hypothetical protein HK102_007617, partial [Quaeritorhiza haematococci]
MESVKNYLKRPYSTYSSSSGGGGGEQGAVKDDNHSSNRPSKKSSRHSTEASRSSNHQHFQQQHHQTYQPSPRKKLNTTTSTITSSSSQPQYLTTGSSSSHRSSHPHLTLKSKSNTMLSSMAAEPGSMPPSIERAALKHSAASSSALASSSSKVSAPAQSLPPGAWSYGMPCTYPGRHNHNNLNASGMQQNRGQENVDPQREVTLKGVDLNTVNEGGRKMSGSVDPMVLAGTGGGALSRKEKMLELAFENGQFSDITLKCLSRPFRLHRVILLQSPFLTRLILAAGNAPTEPTTTDDSDTSDTSDEGSSSPLLPAGTTPVASRTKKLNVNHQGGLEIEIDFGEDGEDSGATGNVGGAERRNCVEGVVGDGEDGYGLTTIAE